MFQYNPRYGKSETGKNGEGFLEEVAFDLDLERFVEVGQRIGPAPSTRGNSFCKVWGGSRVGPERDSRCMEWETGDPGF